MLAVVVPGVLASPALPLSPRPGVASGRFALGQGVLHLVGERHAVFSAGGVVEHDGVLAAVGVVEDQGRTDLAHRRSRETLFARQPQHGLLIEIVTLEMLVDVAQHGVVLEKGHDRVAGRRGAVAGIDRVREIAGIAEIVACRHRRCVGRCEGREQRMRILEVDALVAHRRHRGRRLRRHLQRAQAIGHEKDKVVRCGVLRGCGARGQGEQACGKSQDCAAHDDFPREACGGRSGRALSSFAVRQICYGGLVARFIQIEG